MKTVFLGGTCNGSQWRDVLLLTLNASAVSAYNPVVEDWTPECQAEEIRQRKTCDFCLYVITPKMTGTYSIAEVVDDSNKRPERTLFLILEADESHIFEPHQLKALKQVGKMVEANGGKWFQQEIDLIDFLNSPFVAPVPTRLLLDATVFPSTEKTIVALPTDDKFAGAHNYEIKPMLRYEDGAVYGMEGMPVTFVKRNEDGTWQAGVQTEQLLLMLLDRHDKLNAAVPAQTNSHELFIGGINDALRALASRVNERTRRGVMGESKA